jgi:predicted ester cyclase
MSIAENKELYRRFMEEVVSRGDLRVADELLSPDVIEHEVLPPGLGSGREGIKNLFKLLRSAFPDLHVEIHEQLADGDKVISRVTLRGTHRGELLGIAPTGRRVAYGAIDISRMAGGRLVEHWGVPDYLTLLQQLGAFPAAPPPSSD